MMNETNMKQYENKNVLNMEKEVGQSADDNRSFGDDNASLDKILSINKPELINPSSPDHKEPLRVANINDVTENSTTNIKIPDAELIMNSYNRRSVNELCTRLITELRKLGYHVWIDDDDASGDIQKAVALAIENSFIVLMGINEEYYNSQWCKAFTLLVKEIETVRKS